MASDSLREFIDLFLRFGDTLNASEAKLRSFCKHGVQLEGWLKGELIYFLDTEVAANRISGFDREVRFGGGRKRIDLTIDLRPEQAQERYWVELKHWLIGKQKGHKYSSRFYFSDPSFVGIRPDAEKLALAPEGPSVIIILATCNPGSDDWNSGVSKFNSKFPHLRLSSLTDPGDFPPSYFLGLLEVKSSV